MCCNHFFKLNKVLRTAFHAPGQDELMIDKKYDHVDFWLINIGKQNVYSLSLYSGTIWGIESLLGDCLRHWVITLWLSEVLSH